MESTKITSVIRRIILSLLLVNALSSPAQALVEKVEITQKPVVDRNSSTVTLRVKVTGKNNKPVPLEEQDFSLKIDCNSRRYNCQEIGSKEWKDWKNHKDAKPPPAFIIVLLDFSGSMKGTDSGGRTKYAAAIQAIRGFVVRVAANLTSDRNSIQRAIASLGDGGGTQMAQGINAAVAELQKTSLSRNILLFTDGLPNSKGSTLAAAQSAKTEGINIIAVGTGDADTNYLTQLTGDPAKVF
ncbi:MAG: VWA domain-containing protein [Hormoscilla sp. GUM202]|nr:VWA domain-containing protein [Hormoscilla sp. GUM202]